VIGRGAKIIVHEDKFSLRFNYESLLLRLGANFIMHRDVPAWRLSRVIDSLEGTLFDRAVDVDFGALVNGALPSELYGLVSVDSLISEIDSILQKTKLNNSPKALFTGVVVASRDAENILSAVQADREGDLFAFEGQTIYIFLSACPPSHVTETIERKLKDSLATVFRTTSIWTHTTDIEQQLLDLKHRIVTNPTVPDTAVAAEAKAAIETTPELLSEPESEVEVEVESESNTLESIAAHVFSESVPLVVAIKSPFAAVESPVVAIESPVTEMESPVTEVESPVIEVESPVIAVEPPTLEVESHSTNPAPLIAEPALDHHASEAIPVKFKPLVFLKSRSESDAPKE
jgi:hypothetical protein